jgi:predicted ester cyclase
MSESNKAVIRKALEAYNAADWDGFDAFFEPEYVHHNNADALTLAQFKRGAAWLRVGMPDFQISIEDMVSEADRVAVRITGRGTHRGSLFGETPTSRPITVYGAVLYRLREGKVAEDWESLDESQLRAQVEADGEQR